MNYWLDLFTWRTWNEFLDAGGTISGFKKSRWNTVRQIKPGDLLLCYMTGISRFFAILEVTGEPYLDEETGIWEEDPFPARVPVEVILSLKPEHAVPVKELGAKLSYFQNMTTPHAWTAHFRTSPRQVKSEDAQVIIAALEEAKGNPQHREFDPRKLDQSVRVYGDDEDVAVTIPDESEEIEEEFPAVTHEEIQWLLLDLGSQLGLDVWVARNDRNRSYQGRSFREIPRLRDTLPIQFDEATNRTIELIDVLWLEGNAIVAAFEVEHTTSIYSGLLRMADLISMQPNINIQLYIVAPDERRNKVITEVNRPTFARLHPPLTEVCQFIPYSSLKKELERVGEYIQHLRPDFLDRIAETLEAGA